MDELEEICKDPNMKKTYLNLLETCSHHSALYLVILPGTALLSPQTDLQQQKQITVNLFPADGTIELNLITCLYAPCPCLQ